MNSPIHKFLSIILSILISNLIITCLVFAQEKASIEGIWKGTFHLDFIFKIDRAAEGSLSATFNTPLQEVYNVPIKHVRFVNDSLYLGIELSDVIKSHFTGVLNREKNIIEGYFNDGIYDYPITLEQSNKLLAQMVSRIDADGQRVESYRYNIPQNLDDSWETAHLADSGIDTARIVEVMNKILKEDYKKIHSLLIVKNGKLVVDEYFYGFSNQKKHFIASVTKSVTNSLVGIAVDKGIIKDIHEPVCSYFPEYSDALCTTEKKQIQLYHLLSMSAGLEWDEQSYNYLDSRNSSIAMGNSGDGLCYLFERKLVSRPGEKYVYNSGLPVALSEIIKKASGLTIDKFGEEHLFKPLGIKDYFWEKHPDGTFHAGGGLSILPRDMAKLGLLYMNKGEYKSQHILSKDWFENCSARYMTGKGPEYWNHWSPIIEFINDTPVEVYSAGGLGGQFIYAVPKLNAIVIFTSDFFGFPNQMHEIMRNYLLPAFIAAEEVREQNNYTFKEIKTINNYNWQYHWLSEMACIEAGLKVLDIDCSSAWLYGASGNAFLININDDVSVPSLAEAVHFCNMPKASLGYRIETIECAIDAPDFSKKQKEAWDKIVKALDKGQPCYGLQLDWAPEYYMIFGHDPIGYYYKGIECFTGKGPKLWNEVGVNSSKKLSMKILSRADKAADNVLIKEALQFAVGYYKDRQHPIYTAGPDAYDVWARALQKGTANGYGTALNAAAFAECRRHAGGFLEECKTKNQLADNTLFDDAINHYKIVARKLSDVEKLFPFFISDEQKIANVSDPVKCQQAAQLLREAKEAEIEGIKVLGLILENYNLGSN